MNGPGGCCVRDRECAEVRFGALPSLPAGYSVWRHAEHEHYQGHNPCGWESPITCDRFQARRWCLRATRLDR